MNDIRVDIVHKWESNPPSLKNLLQGLRAVEDPVDIHVHSLAQKDYFFDSKLTSAIELADLSLQTLATFFEVRRKSDVLIVHKTLRRELLEYVLGINVAERLFLRCENVIYSTYDADYVYFPKKARYLFERSALVYATSESIAEKASEFVSNERIRYIPPSVDTDFFNPNISVSSDLKTDLLVLGWVGNPNVHGDNLRYLTDALQDVRFDDVMLRFLLGGESLPPDILSQLEATGATLDLIEYVPWEEVPEVINSFDVGFAPLRDTEFNRGRSSEKVREYMACGVPVIASDVGENPRLIPDETGILIDDGNSWANAVSKLSDPTVREHMGEKARQHVKNTYARSVIAEEIEAALHDVTADEAVNERPVINNDPGVETEREPEQGL